MKDDYNHRDTKEMTRGEDEKPHPGSRCSNYSESKMASQKKNDTRKLALWKNRQWNECKRNG